MALTLKRNPNGYFRRLPRLKKLFWVYFLLLIFEGALRKWVVPQLSAPLLIIRDPISVLIIWEAYRTHKWPARWNSAIALLSVLLIGLFTLQLMAGNNLFAELFGLRTYLLPFPVLFIMGENLDEEDLRRMGALTLWLLLPMALIEAGQYRSGPDSFLNKGASLGAKQIAFIAGSSVRASGTFSFVIGAVEFDILAGQFLFYAMSRDGVARKWLLWASAFALFVSIPMTGSRGTVFQLAVLLACVGIGATMGVAQFAKTLRIGVPIVIVALLVTRLPVFSSAMSDLNRRLSSNDAGGVQGQQHEGQAALDTLLYRIFTPITSTIEDPEFQQNWLGVGMGTGAVAVNAFLSGPKGNAGETEFQREFREMGAIAGSLFAIFKLLLGTVIFARALARARTGDPRALLMVPLAVVWMFFAQLEQPTEQGFVVIGTAFCIAAAKVRVPSVARIAQFVPRPQQYRRRLQQG